MFRILRDTANEVVLTLNEKATITNPTYLIEFTNDETGESNTAIITDTSIYKERYNLFTITESSTENRTAGTLQIRPDGFWTYVVYEQNSTTNLDADLADGEVERGRARVGIGQTEKTSYTRTTTKPAYEKT